MILQALKIVFGLLFLYGVLTGLYGGAILSLLMVGLTHVASQVFARQDQDYMRGKCKRITTVSDTASELDRHCCECTSERI